MTDTCLDLYKNLNIMIREGEIHLSPCCYFNPNNKSESVNFVDNSFLKNLRQQSEKGIWHQTCKDSCFNCETPTNQSRRQAANQWYKDQNLNNKDVELIRIDFWVGDTCNLRCAICGPEFSSAWKEELKIPLKERKIAINDQWQNIDLSKIKVIHFNGGEPLLSKEHVKFLESISNPNQIIINYNTNGTIRPTDYLIELWKQFQLVQLDFSIDDINERFDYQRYPAKWEQVSDNLIWFLNTMSINVTFGINTAVGILNHTNLTKLNDWLDKNFSVDKRNMNISRKQQPTGGLLSLSNTNYNEVVNYLNSLDKRRNTDWKTIFPELLIKIKQQGLA